MRAAALAALAVSFAGAPLAAEAPPAPAPAPAVDRTTASVELTRLKARPGERANLANFIIANWFAMDRKATEQGLFTSYRLLANTDPGGTWDLMVEVGYPTLAGFDHPATREAFEAIRAAHTTVPIKGKTLAELGTIVGTERVVVLSGTR
ncbi:hypothetical protein [Erythrobacter oryzae]|uniref:hypothetical protein n=1 Tax=Erythrobacter oryzae TaxID=3019556 RepID=UPI0025523802|nr:hypothetical protein [Erythrobacter sp. COR-2]